MHVTFTLLLAALPIRTGVCSSETELSSTCTCLSDSVVPDCCCSFRDVTELNRIHVLPLLRQLTNTTFFRYFKVQLCADCLHPNFAPPLCGSPECAVCPASQESVPIESDGVCYLGGDPCDGSSEAEQIGKFDLSISSADGGKLSNWEAKDIDSWTSTQDQEDGILVDLTRNPERWTGYSPLQNSSQIWRAIYEENCFDHVLEGECREERVFSKLLSGMHASISSHISASFCLERDDHVGAPCREFGASKSEFQRRLFDFPERIENLYFLYMFMLRAAIKLRPVFSEFDFDAGTAQEASWIRDQLKTINVASGKYRELPCLSITRTPFDESTLFLGDSSSLLEQFRVQFQNISSIMDCLGCDKCRYVEPGKIVVAGPICSFHSVNCVVYGVKFKSAVSGQL